MEKLRSIYHYFFYLLLKASYFIIFLYKKRLNKPLIVFDIDNTLALTRQSRLRDFELLKPNLNLCKSALYFVESENYEVIFLSVRPYSSYRKTKRWLKRNIQSKNSHHLFFCKSPIQKINFLSSIKMPDRKLLIDDMSYDINNEIFFFEDSIKMIDVKKFSYLGIDFIENSIKVTSNKIIKDIKKIFS